ncbi:MAG: AraC family transcriptional regulator [Anaerolineae bacterium]|nr:AraC family transcriptional regulator [Anaerolineae bacterium]
MLDAESNLANRPGVTIDVSVTHPTGVGARDPGVLLRDPPAALDGQPLSAFLRYRDSTYDTYDGHNRAGGPDWYAIRFPQSELFNCVEMTMECPNRDGGWWTSLDVETLDERGGWQPVHGLTITPAYPFEDTPYGRRPYESYALFFESVRARGVRLIGRPGGLAEFTSLAYLAVFQRDTARWTPALLPQPPVPYLFRLIPPEAIWDLSEHLVKLTGLAINVTTMDHYLDKDRYERWWRRISHNYQGEPDLWQFLGVAIGWDVWNRIVLENALPAQQDAPHVALRFHDSFGQAVAPIWVDGQLLGEMTSHQVIIPAQFDRAWHRRFARQYGLFWPDYLAAMERCPQMTLEQLEGAAALMGMIANTIANLAHRNLRLEKELVNARQSESERRAAEKRAIVQKAIRFMQENLEAPISVADVAREVALSPTYFGVLFGEAMGRSPVDYLIELRIERARTYLAHTRMSVMDVCVALGYDPSYFNRLFKRRTGFTPGQYARQARQKWE